MSPGIWTVSYTHLDVYKRQRQLHADPVGFLRRDLPRLKRLDEVPAQVRALVDGMAAGPGKFDVGGLGGAAEGGHQQFPICLIGIADIDGTKLSVHVRTFYIGGSGGRKWC